MTPTGSQTCLNTSPEGKPKLLDQLRNAIRLRHYSIRTEEAYVQWAKRFILFHNKRHPKDMGRSEIEAFLTHLAVSGKVAASTQNQASTRSCSSIVNCSDERSGSLKPSFARSGRQNSLLFSR